MIRGRHFWLAAAIVALLGAALLMLVSTSEASQVPRCHVTVGSPGTDVNKVMRVYGGYSCPGAISVLWRTRIVRAKTPWSTNGGMAPTQPYGYRACKRGGKSVNFYGEVRVLARFAGTNTKSYVARGPVITWRCLP